VVRASVLHQPVLGATYVLPRNKGRDGRANAISRGCSSGSVVPFPPEKRAPRTLCGEWLRERAWVILRKDGSFASARGGSEWATHPARRRMQACGWVRTQTYCQNCGVAEVWWRALALCDHVVRGSALPSKTTIASRPAKDAEAFAVVLQNRIPVSRLTEFRFPLTLQLSVSYLASS